MGTYRVTNTPNPSHSGCSHALLVSLESCRDAVCQGGSSSRGTAFPFLSPSLDLKSHPLLKGLLIRDRAQTKHRKCSPATLPSSAHFPHAEGSQVSNCCSDVCPHGSSYGNKLFPMASFPTDFQEWNFPCK